MSSRTTPYDIERIAKYPDALQIYRIHASKFFQVRLFVERKYVRRSTKCVDRRDAIEFAKRFYDEIRIAQRLDFSVHADTFAACASHLIKHQASLVNRDERDARINIEDEKKLNKDILPYFQTRNVADITTIDIEDYIADLTAKRKLSPSTLSKHLVVIRKVLNEARKRNFIKTVPPFPTIRRKDNPRAYFNDQEYATLRRTSLVMTIMCFFLNIEIENMLYRRFVVSLSSCLSMPTSNMTNSTNLEPSTRCAIQR